MRAPVSELDRRSRAMPSAHGPLLDYHPHRSRAGPLLQRETHSTSRSPAHNAECGIVRSFVLSKLAFVTSTAEPPIGGSPTTSVLTVGLQPGATDCVR